MHTQKKDTFNKAVQNKNLFNKCIVIKIGSTNKIFFITFFLITYIKKKENTKNMYASHA